MRNENDKLISFRVERTSKDEVRVVATGPDSTADHTWTLKEAEVLAGLLAVVTGS